ncbi:MAG: NADH-quinone oxidoreductase subunit C [Verrucomicrobia bacterium]|jgi:NADH-quinone oxidoreductase subunit C|nr:NADH-quinone oxidoreductase subunit C [Verrucomicrobiota bacterium]
MSTSLDELQAAFLKLTASSTLPQAGSEALPLPAEGTAAATTPPPSPVQIVDAKAKGYHLDVTVTSDQVVAAAEIARQHGFGMDTVTGVDWMAAGQMEIVYDFFHPASVLHLVIRTRVPRDKPELPTIQGVFPGANWHERETHEFFAIKFLGHPNLTPLLLPEDADFYPLRKDFAGAA